MLPYQDTLSLPVIAAPMFLISGPDLVLACCKNGIIGTFPALNQRTTEGFEEWVVRIKQELAAYEAETGKKAPPFGVNLIVHHTNPRVQPDLAVIMKHQVPIVITSLGIVPDLIKAVQSYGGKVYHDVIKKRHAEKAAEAGVDGLILVSAGAGGHGGTLNPMPFVQEVRSFFDGHVILSGTMSNGRDVASAMQMGADMAYMGTRFINTTEAMAPDGFQEMIVETGTADIIYTAAVSGVNANFMRPSLEAMGITKEMWGMTKKMDFSSESGADSEAKAWKTIWSAGQGVATIDDVLPVADLVARMKGEFRDAITQQSKLLDLY